MAEVYLFSQAGLYADMEYGQSLTDPDFGHIWVLLKLGGEKFYIDPTWDDASTGLGYFGVDNTMYEEADIEIAGTYFWDLDEELSTRYESLWQMQEINSLTRVDGTLVIDFVDADGENQVFVVEEF